MLLNLKQSVKFCRRWASIAISSVLRAGAAISPWAGIAAAIVGIFALSFGYKQFRATQEATRQTLSLQREGLDLDRDAKAIDLFLKYNDLMVQPRSSRKSGIGDAAFWRENLAVGIADSIFKIRGEDTSWKETVRWMIDDHKDFFNENGLDCATYDPDFVQLVNQEMKHNICVTP